MTRRAERQRRKKPEGAETRRGTEPDGRSPPLGLTREAMALGGAGVVIAIVGFWLVGQGSITAAPLLLVVAYLILIPLALIR